jgi:hypothetical protein
MATNYREFTIQRPDYSDMLKVRVYKTVKTMHNGALKTNKDKSTLNFSAMFQATYAIDNDDHGYFTSNHIGTIFFNEQNLDITHISHECIHAAFAWDRNINHYFGNHNNYDDEERLAFYYDWLLVEVIKTLKKAGYKISLNIV